MNEIHCRQCGEPYSEYTLRHDVPEWDDQPDDAHEKFMNGDGCPTCNWGEKAGEISLSKNETEEETEQRHIQSLIEGTDDDPLKYL